MNDAHSIAAAPTPQYVRKTNVNINSIFSTSFYPNLLGAARRWCLSFLQGAPWRDKRLLDDEGRLGLPQLGLPLRGRLER